MFASVGKDSRVAAVLRVVDVAEVDMVTSLYEAVEVIDVHRLFGYCFAHVLKI